MLFNLQMEVWSILLKHNFPRSNLCCWVAVFVTGSDFVVESLNSYFQALFKLLLLTIVELKLIYLSSPESHATMLLAHRWFCMGGRSWSVCVTVRQPPGTLDQLWWRGAFCDATSEWPLTEQSFWQPRIWCLTNSGRQRFPPSQIAILPDVPWRHESLLIHMHNHPRASSANYHPHRFYLRTWQQAETYAVPPHRTKSHLKHVFKRTL